MTLLPGTPALRRRLAFAALLVGGALILRAADRDLPREQTLIFRPSAELRERPLTLSASITRAGESEARSGFTVTRESGDRSEIRHTLRAPNGDYVLTVEFFVPAPTASAGAAPGKPSEEKRETSSVHRVTLGGGDIVVPIGPRVSE